MTVIEKLEVHLKQVALRTTFKTALREVSEFQVAQVVINGSGCGEAVGVRAVTGESTEAIVADLRHLNLIGQEVTEASLFYNSTIKPLNISLGAKAALDMAIRDLTPTHPVKIKSDVTIPVANLESYPELFKARSDFSVFKIKLDNEALVTLIAKIEKAREIFPNASLRVDPNQSWDIKLAVAFLKELDKRALTIDYLEQPCLRSGYDAFWKIKEETGGVLMADEACFTHEDLHKLIAAGGVDYVNLKVLKHGGVTPTLELAELAKSAGLKVSLGSMMESERGVKVAAQIAAAVEPEFVHDLDAAWWLRESSLRYENGVLFA